MTGIVDSDPSSLRKARNVFGVHENMCSLAGMPIGYHSYENCRFLAKFDLSEIGLSQKLSIYSILDSE